MESLSCHLSITLLPEFPALLLVTEDLWIAVMLLTYTAVISLYYANPFGLLPLWSNNEVAFGWLKHNSKNADLLHVLAFNAAALNFNPYSDPNSGSRPPSHCVHSFTIFAILWWLVTDLSSQNNLHKCIVPCDHLDVRMKIHHRKQNSKFKHDDGLWLLLEKEHRSNSPFLMKVKIGDPVDMFWNVSNHSPWYGCCKGGRQHGSIGTVFNPTNYVVSICFTNNLVNG